MMCASSRYGAALFLAAALLVAASGGGGFCLAWTTGSAVSSFGGSVLITGTAAPPPKHQQQHQQLVMKKGKANVPPNMRSQYKKQQEMAQMQKQMINAQKAGEDGLPVFNLFVRTKRANVSTSCERKHRKLEAEGCGSRHPSSGKQPPARTKITAR